jgi:hypothetical protein
MLSAISSRMINPAPEERVNERRPQLAATR